MEQNDILRYAVDALAQMKVSYALVGSFASGIHGEPRFTKDIDIVIELFPYQVARFCKRFPGPEFYLSEAAVQEAVRLHGQFNVIHPTSGNKIDFMLNRTDAWGKKQLSRRQAVQLFPDRTGFVASPEDVILGKLVYYHEGGSEKHLRDITGILRLCRDEVDRQYIARFAEQLEVTEVWEAVLLRLSEQ